MLKKDLLKTFLKERAGILLLALILLFSFVIRFYSLDKIPVNLTGDESWDLSNIYKIAFGAYVSPLALLGDGSIPAIIYYPVAIAIKIFGTSMSIFFLRLNIVIYSLLALVGFYFVLKSETSKFISFIFTILLSSNYIFLNFSRTAWVNMASVFSGLFLIYFLEKAIKTKKNINYLAAGIFAGASFYSYHYGRILVGFIIIYLILKLIRNYFRADIIIGSIIFVITSFIVAFPFMVSAGSGNNFSLLTRPEATFAFSPAKISGGSFNTVLWHQVSYTFRGFILLDGSVMSEVIENQRYVPLNIPPVDLVIKIIFWASLVYFLVKKKTSIWWIIMLSILVTEALSDLPPNFSRGLFYIPLIYFFSGVFIYKALIYTRNSIRIKKYLNLIYMSLIILTFLMVINDVNAYFTWMKQPYEYNARQPGIDYKEFSAWQKYQIHLVENGMPPIVNQEWYQIRDSVLKD